MLTDLARTACDSASELRLKLETLKALYDLFCHSFDLDATTEQLIQSVKYNAYNMQLLADALLTMLCDVLSKAREAERDADRVHDCAASKEPPPPEKEAALRVVLSSFTLEEKRQLRDQLRLMTQ